LLNTVFQYAGSGGWLLSPLPTRREENAFKKLLSHPGIPEISNVLPYWGDAGATTHFKNPEDKRGTVTPTRWG